MIGDKLLITDYHRKAVAKILPAVKHKLAAGSSCVTVSVGGESGSGKSEIANCLAKSLEELGKTCLILCQDDYFRLPPKSNHQKRQADISWVGLGEVRLDLMEAHVFSLKEHPEKPLSKPLVEFEEDRIGCEIIERGIRDVVIIEGCYTTLLSNVDVRVFIDRNYLQTKKSRTKRARDPSDVFLERVLKIEHDEIAEHKNRADIVIAPPASEARSQNGKKNSTKTIANNVSDSAAR